MGRFEVTKHHRERLQRSASGKHGTLTAFVKYSGKKFDVQAMLVPQGDKWISQRNKTAYKPIGVCFKYSER
ncbi:hypothetical protein ACWCQP_00915 [Streptomyces chartreusis]